MVIKNVVMQFNNVDILFCEKLDMSSADARYVISVKHNGTFKGLEPLFSKCYGGLFVSTCSYTVSHVWLVNQYELYSFFLHTFMHKTGVMSKDMMNTTNLIEMCIISSKMRS